MDPINRKCLVLALLAGVLLMYPFANRQPVAIADAPVTTWDASKVTWGSVTGINEDGTFVIEPIADNDWSIKTNLTLSAKDFYPYIVKCASKSPEKLDELLSALFVFGFLKPGVTADELIVSLELYGMPYSVDSSIGFGAGKVFDTVSILFGEGIEIELTTAGVDYPGSLTDSADEVRAFIRKHDAEQIIEAQLKIFFVGEPSEEFPFITLRLDLSSDETMDGVP